MVNVTALPTCLTSLYKHILYTILLKHHYGAPFIFAKKQNEEKQKQSYFRFVRKQAKHFKYETFNPVLQR
jgi:hypothetical protein